MFGAAHMFMLELMDFTGTAVELAQGMIMIVATKEVIKQIRL